ADPRGKSPLVMEPDRCCARRRQPAHVGSCRPLPKIAEGRSHVQLRSDANPERCKFPFRKNSLISPLRQHKNLSESSPLAGVRPPDGHPPSRSKPPLRDG